MMLSVYLQTTLSISPERVNDIDQVSLGWMEEITKYLYTGEVPEDGKQAHKHRVQAM